MQQTCSAHVDQVHEWGVWPACRFSSNSVHQSQSVSSRLQRSHQAPCPLLRLHSRRHLGRQRRHRLRAAASAAPDRGHSLIIDIGEKLVRHVVQSLLVHNKPVRPPHAISMLYVTAAAHIRDWRDRPAGQWGCHGQKRRHSECSLASEELALQIFARQWRTRAEYIKDTMAALESSQKHQINPRITVGSPKAGTSTPEPGQQLQLLVIGRLALEVSHPSL